MNNLSKYTNKIIQGDCLEIIQNIPNNSVDMTFADPPFNLKKSYRSYKDRLEFQEYIIWCEKWITEMVRVTKPTGSIFIHNIPKWLTYYSTLLRTPLITQFQFSTWSFSQLAFTQAGSQVHWTYALSKYSFNSAKLRF